MRVVVAKKPYRGKAVGTEVDIRARDARVLIALGLMVHPVAAVVVEAVAEDEPKPQKRTYRRRDMTAEG